MMANNRMYLVHRPTGRGIHIGSRGAWGWATAKYLQADLKELFSSVADDPCGPQDDFIVVMEDVTDAPATAELATAGQPDPVSGLRQITVKETR